MLKWEDPKPIRGRSCGCVVARKLAGPEGVGLEGQGEAQGLKGKAWPLKGRVERQGLKGKRQGQGLRQ